MQSGGHIQNHRPHLKQRLDKINYKHKWISEPQYGFTCHKGTHHQIFRVQAIMQEIHKTKTLPYYGIFIDIYKAFDSIPRELIRETIKTFKQPKTLNLLNLILDNYKIAVPHTNTILHPTNSSTGREQLALAFQLCISTYS